MNKKNIFRLMPFLVIVFALTFSVILELIKSESLYLVTIGLMVASSIFLFAREFKILWNYFTNYMFNLEKSVQFDKHIERPRLFFYLIFGFLNIFSFYQLLNIGNIEFTETLINIQQETQFALYNHLFFVVFWFSTSLLIFTWTKTFTQKFIPKIRKKMQKANRKRFKPKWKNKDNYRKLYDNLIDENLIIPLKIDSELQDYDLFINCLFENEIPEEPLFKVEMDNIQSRLFFDLLIEGSKGLTLKTMTKIFRNKNGNIKYRSFLSSKANNDSGPKKDDIIKRCFDV